MECTSVSFSEVIPVPAGILYNLSYYGTTDESVIMQHITNGLKLAVGVAENNIDNEEMMFHTRFAFPTSVDCDCLTEKIFNLNVGFETGIYLTKPKQYYIDGFNNEPITIKANI